MMHSKFSSFIWIKLRYVTYSESSIKPFLHKMTEVFPSPPGTARPLHTSEDLLMATAGLGAFSPPSFGKAFCLPGGIPQKRGTQSGKPGVLWRPGGKVLILKPA